MIDEFDKTSELEMKKAEYDAIPVISYAQLKEVVNKWLLIIDPGVVKLVLATIISNRIPSDPVWLFLLAPSGGGKTELMNALLKCPDYYPLSQLTTNTFLSGYKKKDTEASLLKRLKYGTTIGLKDFTSILDGNKDDMKDIMGQFREIYDGHMKKTTGTGDEIVWSGKIGFLAGCTPILEQRMSMIGAMGERFLNYKMKQPVRRLLRAKMRENIGKEGKMREELQDAFAGFLKGVEIPEELPKVSEKVDTIIESMTDFIAISRSVVMRGWDTKKEIEYISEPEMSSRTYKQLYAIALSLMIINNGEWFEEDDYILRKLAISSVHSIRYNLIRHLMTYKTQVKTSTLATELGYPTSITRRYLEDLGAISMDDGAIRIINRDHQGTGRPDLWGITPEMKEILRLMGEEVEPTKEDSGFEETEQDVAVGVSGNGKYEENKLAEVDYLTEGMSQSEKESLGI